MGNRSRYAVLGGAALAAAVAARRRNHLRAAARGIGRTILPTTVIPEDEPVGDGRAPGHRHRPPDDVGRIDRATLRRRPWTRHGYGDQHPYALD